MKVIFTVFAGRRRYMEILLRYVDKLKVDQVHLWNFTRTDEDDEYINTLSDKYTIINVENKKSWNEYYAYYKSDPEIILIKCDDDIVYIDIDMFDNFIEYIKNSNTPLVYSASVVNNSVCHYAQKQYGLWEDIHLENLITTTEDAKNVNTIHDSFINNKENFLKKSRLLLPTFIPGDFPYKININFVAFKGEDLDLLFDNDDVGLNDEDWIGGNARHKLSRPIVIDLRFTVSHMAFTKQREGGYDEKQHLSSYETFSMM